MLRGLHDRRPSGDCRLVRHVARQGSTFGCLLLSRVAFPSSLPCSATGKCSLISTTSDDSSDTHMKFVFDAPWHVEGLSSKTNPSEIAPSSGPASRFSLFDYYACQRFHQARVHSVLLERGHRRHRRLLYHHLFKGGTSLILFIPLDHAELHCFRNRVVHVCGLRSE